MKIPLLPSQKNKYWWIDDDDDEKDKICNQTKDEKNSKTQVGCFLFSVNPGFCKLKKVIGLWKVNIMYLILKGH